MSSDKRSNTYYWSTNPFACPVGSNMYCPNNMSSHKRSNMYWSTNMSLLKRSNMYWPINMSSLKSSNMYWSTNMSSRIGNNMHWLHQYATKFNTIYNTYWNSYRIALGMEKWENLNKNRNNTRYPLDLGQMWQKGIFFGSLISTLSSVHPISAKNTRHTRFCLFANKVYKR